MKRVALITLASLAGLWFVPAIHQDPHYHSFADASVLFGVPHFWNVVSNLPFLLVALYGLKAFRSRGAFVDLWERAAYGLLLLGTAGVAFGSAYYHANPDDERLFWDRLPMAVVFTSLVASTVGERVSSRAGRALLVPLVLLGVGSVLEWRWSGDLRLYGLVQFGAMAALLAMVARYPARYTQEWGVRCLGLFYVLAKLCESFDREVASVIAGGGHPWKHVCAAVAMWCYVEAVARRNPRVGLGGTDGGKGSSKRLSSNRSADGMCSPVSGR